jgi:hypothetical protein
VSERASERVLVDTTIADADSVKMQLPLTAASVLMHAPLNHNIGPDAGTYIKMNVFNNIIMYLCEKLVK